MAVGRIFRVVSCRQWKPMSGTRTARKVMRMISMAKPASLWRFPCGDGLQHPRPDEGESERVGANHPLAMLRDVAVARREECGCGSNHPSASLAAGGDHEVDGAGIVTVIREDDGERRGDEDCNHVGSAENTMQPWEAAADAAGKLQRAAEQRQEPSGNVRPDEQGDGAEVCTFLCLPQRHFTVQADGDRRGRDDNPESQLARMDSP